jgi:8-oxo-dGTP pyrophosphatase MutT (NUDIX family)
MDVKFIPAATLVIMRETTGVAPELLMIERGAEMAFAAGALVFPGGRIDPGDHAIATTPSLLSSDTPWHPDEAAARVAAIRETIEEVGIAIGLDPLPEAPATAQLRAALAEGGDFAALLARSGYRLDLDRLTAFARWRPNMRETRNFDTRFYIAAAPDAAIAEADGSESVRSLWISAAAALADADSGHHRIIFPTRRNLERLAAFATMAELVAHAASHPVAPITPWIEERDGERWLCIPDGHGYPVTSEPVATALRG